MGFWQNIKGIFRPSLASGEVLMDMGHEFRNRPVRIDTPDHSHQGDPLHNHNGGKTPIIRDVGLNSRTLREAIEVLQEAAPTLPGLSLFMDKYGFRSLTQNIRDINDQIRINLLNRAETLSITNGLANRALQIRTDLIVSEGFRVESDTKIEGLKEIVQKVLDEHWELNNWDKRTYERVFDLGVTGEMIRRVPALFSNIGGEDGFPLGKFNCGVIAPQLVYGISLDSWNYENLDRLYLEQYAFPNASSKDLSLKVISDERLGIDEFGSVRGDVFYLGVNRRPGCSRGLTDLAPAIDWLDIYDQILMSDCERAQLMMRYIWDVTLENASPSQIRAYCEQLKIGGPKPGTVRVHSHKEIWDAVSPDLKLADSKELREDIFKLAWGSMGLPLHWFVDSENVNKSNGENMTDPTFAWARTRRRMFVAHLDLEFKYALQVAYDAGRFPDIAPEDLAEAFKIKVVSRDPDRKGYEAVGSAWADIANALTVLVTQGFVDKQSAIDITRTVLGSYGFEIDPDNMTIQNAYDTGDYNGEPGGHYDEIGNPITTATNAVPGAQGIVGIPGEGFQNVGGGGGMQESRRPLNSKKGFMTSKNPVDALLQEAMKALKDSHRKQRELMKHF